MMVLPGETSQWKRSAGFRRAIGPASGSPAAMRGMASRWRCTSSTSTSGATGAGATALMLAAASGKTTAVKTLLDRGADLHAKEPLHQETALMFAVANNRLDAMKVLLDAGASVKGATKVVDLTWNTTTQQLRFFGKSKLLVEHLYELFEKTFEMKLTPAGPYHTALELELPKHQAAMLGQADMIPLHL